MSLPVGSDAHGVPTSAGSIFRRVDHIAIAVHDIASAIEHWSSHFGLPCLGVEHATEPGVRLAYLDCGNLFLQLVSPTREGPVADFLKESGEGLHHVCFLVDDIPDALEQLDETQSRLFRGGRARRACFITERPHGARIELTETEPSFAADAS